MSGNSASDLERWGDTDMSCSSTNASRRSRFAQSEAVNAALVGACARRRSNVARARRRCRRTQSPQRSSSSSRSASPGTPESSLSESADADSSSFGVGLIGLGLIDCHKPGSATGVCLKLGSASTVAARLRRVLSSWRETGGTRREPQPGDVGAAGNRLPLGTPSVLYAVVVVVAAGVVVVVVVGSS